jgi:hypothetical protein
MTCLCILGFLVSAAPVIVISRALFAEPIKSLAEVSCGGVLGFIWLKIHTRGIAWLRRR